MNSGPKSAITSDWMVNQMDDKYWKDYEIQLPDGSWSNVASLLETERLRAAIEELKRFVDELNKQSPYDPLPGTPREYVESKMSERQASLTNQLEGIEKER